MNTAMTLYDKHFYGKEIDIAIQDLKASILIRDDFKSETLASGYEKITFSDCSKLIFTYDNVQVTLF